MVRWCLIRMDFRSLKYVLVVFIAFGSVGCATKVVDVERERMLALPFDEFDQTEGSGFRLLLG